MLRRNWLLPPSGLSSGVHPPVYSVLSWSHILLFRFYLLFCCHLRFSPFLIFFPLSILPLHSLLNSHFLCFRGSALYSVPAEHACHTACYSYLSFSYRKLPRNRIASAHFCLPVDLFCPRLNQWRIKSGRETSGQFCSIHRIYRLKVRCSRCSFNEVSGVVCVTLGKYYPRFLRSKMHFYKFWSIVHNLGMSKYWHKSKNGICLLWTWSLHLYWPYDESICQKSFVTCCQPAYRGIYLTHWSTYYRACVERLMSPTSRYV
jgi:hypothetical protein